MVFLSYWSTHKLDTTDPVNGTIATILLWIGAFIILAYAIHSWRKKK